jgi:signal transduction histidine kinase
MNVDQPSPYLRLSQFLDLESRWLGASDQDELCHRICRTIVILLEPAAAAIGLQREGEAYRIVAAEGDWSGSAVGEGPGGSLLRRALTTATPQLKSLGDTSIGVFPFHVGARTDACLHVKLDRPLFRGAEVSFLRFIASLASIVLAGTPARAEVVVEPAAPAASKRDEAAARRYVAMAVHDLRNPLNVVAGYANLLADRSLGELGDQQRDAVEAIERQVGTLLSVVDQLIELDRITSCSDTIHPTTFELRPLFEEIRATCFPHANGRVRWPGPEASFEFTTDRRRVFSIVQNLVDNALKHGNGEVEVGCTRSNRELVVDVSDGGPGLAPEIRKSMMEHVANGNEFVPRAGLGLYSVACYVKSLGGGLEIRERERGGTSIEVRLPTYPSARDNGR